MAATDEPARNRRTPAADEPPSCHASVSMAVVVYSARKRHPLTHPSPAPGEALAPDARGSSCRRARRSSWSTWRSQSLFMEAYEAARSHEPRTWHPEEAHDGARVPRWLRRKQPHACDHQWCSIGVGDVPLEVILAVAGSWERYGLGRCWDSGC